ncbi:MAG: MutT/NUDIX family pyrophosphohydrolase protein/(deoxy)nucleoside triphosphate pyrophosphohydrolase [Treponematales bacterium]
MAGIVAEGERFFAAKRKAGGAIGGKWEFPGGKVESGESDEAALAREFAEELGCAVKVGAALGSVSVSRGDGTGFTLHGYEAVFLSRDFSGACHDEYRWVTAGEIERGELDFADSDRRLFEVIRGKINGAGV